MAQLSATPLPATTPRWTVVLAYYNELAFIEATLASWAAQTLPLRLILVDNASTDGSPALVKDFLAQHPQLDAVMVAEPAPGHLLALETGAALAAGDFIAFSDADTLYPPGYLARAQTLLARPGVAAALAVDLYAPPHALETRLRRLKFAIVTRLLDRQSHTGSYGYCFTLAAYRACGGFSARRWPWVLYDHELIHCIAHQGRLAYDHDFWCLASDRRTPTREVRWNLAERILYSVTPFRWKDWFFYRYLGPRFEARRMGFINLRQRNW